MKKIMAMSRATYGSAWERESEGSDCCCCYVLNPPLTVRPALQPAVIWWRSTAVSESPRLCSAAWPIASLETVGRRWWTPESCPPHSERAHTVVMTPPPVIPRTRWSVNRNLWRTHTELSDDDIDDTADHNQSVKRVPGVDEVMLQENSFTEPTQTVWRRTSIKLQTSGNVTKNKLPFKGADHQKLNNS